MDDRNSEEDLKQVIPRVVMSSMKSEYKSTPTKLAPLHEDHFTSWLSMNKTKSPHKQQKINSVLLNMNDNFYKKPKVIKHSISTFDFKDNQSIGYQKTFASNIKKYHSKPLSSLSMDKITLGRCRLHTMSKSYPFHIKNNVDNINNIDLIQLDNNSVGSYDSLSQIDDEYHSTFHLRKHLSKEFMKQQLFTKKLDSSNDNIVSSKSKDKLNSMIDELSSKFILFY